MKIKNIILKTILYRTCATIGTLIIAYLLTGNYLISGGIALSELILKLLFYYFFEIIWNKIMSKKNMETLWFNGLSGSGKTAIGKKLINILEKEGKKVFLLDGDVLRDGLNHDLGFSVEDRIENIRRAAEVAKILNQNGIMVIATFITPTNIMRNNVKNIIPDVKFIHLNTSLKTCEERDVKGLYKKARKGKIVNFTGIDSPFEDMDNPWLKIDTEKENIMDSVNRIMNKLN